MPPAAAETAFRPTFRRPLAALAIVTLVTASCQGGAARTPSTSPRPAPPVPASGVVRIDPGTNRIVGGIELSRPNVVELGLNAVWVTNNQTNTAQVVRIDLASEALTPIDLGPAIAISPDDLAVGAGAAWAIIGDRVYRVKPGSGRVASTVRGLPRGDLLSSIVVDGDRVWVADATRGTLLRVDPSADRVVETIDVGPSADRIAAGGGSVWVTNIVDDIVSRIDPATGQVAARIHVSGTAGGIAVGEGGVWVTDPSSGSVAVIDPVTGAVQSIRVGAGPTGVAVGEGAVWVANTSDGTLSRIDPATREVVATVRLGGHPYSVAAGGGSVWVTLLRNVGAED